jgi:hypothetical protein
MNESELKYEELWASREAFVSDLRKLQDDYAALERTVGEMRDVLEAWRKIHLDINRGKCTCALGQRVGALLAPKQAEEPHGQQ